MHSLVSGVMISIDVPAQFESDITNILVVAQKSLVAIIVVHRSWAFADDF